jgi:hypothetical protein
MSKENEKKPTIELLGIEKLFTVKFCNPVKEQVNQIKICRPNIEIQPCNPIEKTNCLPDVMAMSKAAQCIPTVKCGPTWTCGPDFWGENCLPDIILECLPTTGKCQPTTPCGPSCTPNCAPNCMPNCMPNCAPNCLPKCQPRINCTPSIVNCRPDLVNKYQQCGPDYVCNPTNVGCAPNNVCGPAVVDTDLYKERMVEISAKIDKIMAEIEELKKKVTK